MLCFPSMRFEPFHTRLTLRYIEEQQQLRDDSESEYRCAEGGVAIYDAIGPETRLILQDTLDCGDVVLSLLQWLASRKESVRMDLSPLTHGVTPEDLREMGCEERPACQVFVRSVAGHDLFRAKGTGTQDSPVSVEWAEGARLEETLHTITRVFTDREDPTKDMLDVSRTLARLGEYMALVLEDKVIAGGGLFVDGEIAYLTGGAVLPAYRGKHLHETLIRARLARAAEMGATQAWVTSAPGGRSERNLLRAGFTKAYERPHFVFQRP